MAPRQPACHASGVIFVFRSATRRGLYSATFIFAGDVFWSDRHVVLSHFIIPLPSSLLWTSALPFDRLRVNDCILPTETCQSPTVQTTKENAASVLSAGRQAAKKYHLLSMCMALWFDLHCLLCIIEKCCLCSCSYSSKAVIQCKRFFFWKVPISAVFECCAR